MQTLHDIGLVRPAARRVRLGLVCPGTRLPAWQLRLLTALRATPEVRLELLVFTEPGAPQPAAARTPSLQARDASALLADFPVLCHASRDERGRLTLDPQPLQTARALDLDVLLLLGAELPSEALGGLARHGVWALRHGAAAALPLQRELQEGAAVATVRLVRLDPGLGHERVLREARLPIRGDAWSTSLERVLRATETWPARLCQALAEGELPPDGPASPLRSPAWPTFPDALRMRAAEGRQRLRRLRAMSRFVHWNIGVVDAPIHRFLEPGFRPQVRWLPELPTRFLADPGALVDGEGLLIAVEDYDHCEERGVISAVRSPDGRTFSAPEPVIRLPVHMSYPYLFEEDGRRYCLPETSEGGELALYEIRPQGPWPKVATVLDGFPAVDATYFRHQGHAWILCGRAGGLEDCELHAFYAPGLQGPWRPHPGNPLTVDAAGSRPAGTPFVHEGALYRPAQDCSVRYGGAVALQRVLELSPTSFREETVRRVEPDPDGPYPDGLHTLCAAGRWTIVDGYRSVNLREAPGRVVSIRVAKLLRRLGLRR